jgi:peroxiredoxin
MTKTPSTMLELGTIAPDFQLAAPDGRRWVLSEQTIDQGLLVMFICNHCPYVKHLRPVLVEAVRGYQRAGITVVAINANDASTYPDDSPEKMAEDSASFKYSFPYLVDEEQTVARAYRAACTPDFFLFDADRKLIYRGQFDGARPGNGIEVSGADLNAAVADLVAGREISVEQKPSLGCNIKWKAGNEPDYFG